MYVKGGGPCGPFGLCLSDGRTVTRAATTARVRIGWTEYAAPLLAAYLDSLPLGEEYWFLPGGREHQPPIPAEVVGEATRLFEEEKARGRKAEFSGDEPTPDYRYGFGDGLGWDGR